MRRMFAALPDLKLVACNGAGLEKIDLAEARKRGVAVCHTPDELAKDVADGAIALTYAIMRRIVEGRPFCAGRPLGKGASRRLHAGWPARPWAWSGLARSGVASPSARTAIGMQVKYYGPRARPDTPYPFVADVRALAAEADVLVLSCPGGEATRHLINQAVLERLGRTAILINVSRGSVVDEAALLDALERKSIAGAALDVFDSEPNINPRFLALENVVLQPHSSSITHETRAAMVARLLGDIDAFVNGRPFFDAAATTT